MATDLVHACHDLELGVDFMVVLRYFCDERNCLLPWRWAKPFAWFRDLHLVDYSSSFTNFAGLPSDEVFSLFN